MRRGGFAPLAVAIAAACSLVLAFGGVARAASGTVPCTLTITDATGHPITTITANTPVVLTATATFGSPPTADDAAVFSDASTGLDVTGEPVTTSFDGTHITWTLTTQSLIAGDHSFYFTFISSNGVDYCITDNVPLHVGALEPTETDTTVDLSSAAIEAGQMIDITATVVQKGTAIAPPGGNVTFWSKREGASGFIQIGARPLVDGHATLQNVGGWTAGRYTIEARYAGDAFQFAASQGDAQLVAHGASILTYGPTSSVAVGDTATLSATLTNNELQPAVGSLIAFNVVATGDSCTATTDVSGKASCTIVAHGPAGVSSVQATFAGDAVNSAASATGQLTITRTATTLTVAHAAAASGSSVALSATLTTQSGTPAQGQSVTLSIAGNPSQTCTGTTNASGVATCSVTVTQPAGTYAVTGSFAGTADAYLSSNGANAIDVVPAPTTLTYTGSAFAVPGSSATISFVLKAGTTTLAGRPVTITFDGVPYNTTTDANGVASVVIANPTGTAPHTATAAFAGDDFFGPSTQTQTIPTGIPTSLQYIGDTSVVSSGTATLKIKLTDTVHNTPVAGASVTITLASGETCTVVTDASGIGSCTKRVNAGAGPDAVTAAYAGVLPYLPSTGAGSIAVSATRTALVLAPVTPTLRGSSAQLGGFLVSTQTAQPLAGKTLTLTLGSQSCVTGPTNSLGFATCTIPSVTAPIGLVTVKGTFAGDASALASTAPPIQAIVYGLAPGNCWFVVGDRDVDGGQVNFWGSQWWKNNHLSRSSTDAAFKGYATSRSGATWTSKPGNSSSPPAGPLPAYMAVIVSSSMSKSGSTISGDVVKVVIVRTDGGYDANPGHAGTGTVVATLP